ncbi:MAG TPA: ABC transporter ATP-binding protein [Bacteroidia bacterium]|nr:ABC transporter ATP-binding protein [Bacteroidia bacterium]
MKPAIEIHNLSKIFRLRHDRRPYLSMRESLSGMFRFRKIETETFYALNDVSFDVNPGDSIGIIGKNGAGKSTLLKVLSRITPPTSGRIKLRGRVASLLEVGTGFHPELSGRENIFLNGSILGMKRNEILQNFDAIVDFAGVEKFIDTPLKHYSSGMQLRLAFAVAAFLQPEILIIDEVLAVGDAEFQKKCMGKMEDISKSGRTILFVSHNLGAVNQLCRSTVLLRDGKVSMTGKTSEVSRMYLDMDQKQARYSFDGTKENGMFFRSVHTENSRREEKREFMHNESMHVVSVIDTAKYTNGMWLCIALLDKLKSRVFSAITPVAPFYSGKKETTITLTVPPDIIAPNHYSFLAAVYFPGGGHTDWLDDICPVFIADNGTEFASYNDYGNVILHNCKWSSE